MTETLITDDKSKVYEIGYLLLSSVPGEKVADIAASLKNALLKKGANMIAEEIPELRDLAYDMVKKIGTQNHTFEKAYFGWLKFELASKEIEGVKKEFEMNPDMLRMLLVTTVKENTYLGKKASIIAETAAPEISTQSLGLDLEKTPASVEEMDKSIDEMVKGA